MLYFELNGYEEFKELFGKRECGNGVVTRNNSMLLTFWKDAFRRKDKEALLRKATSHIYPYIMYRIEQHAICEILYSTQRLAVVDLNISSPDYYLDDMRGVCMDGDTRAIRYARRDNCKVCACNISCGYYNPHTDSEATKVSELRNCLDLVCNIIDNCKDVYPHEYERKAFSYNSYHGNYTPYRHDDWYLHNSNDYDWYDDGKNDSDTLWYNNDGYNEQLDMLYELMEECMTNNSFDEYGLDLFYEAEKDNFPALTKADYHNAYEDIKQWYGAYVTED